jgi:hypothetical protein
MVPLTTAVRFSDPNKHLISGTREHPMLMLNVIILDCDIRTAGGMGPDSTETSHVDIISIAVALYQVCASLATYIVTLDATRMYGRGHLIELELMYVAPTIVLSNLHFM